MKFHILLTSLEIFNFLKIRQEVISSPITEKYERFFFPSKIVYKKFSQKHLIGNQEILYL
jgi:hypothetical protein